MIKKHKDYDKRVRSAKYLILVVLAASKNTDSHPRHIDELLSVLIWKVSEANGKAHTRYSSRGYEALSDKRQGQHEHVNERRHLIDRLLKEPDYVEKIEEDAIGCMVTKEEHERLHCVDPSLRGWDRYKAAGVECIDLWA